MSNKQKNILKYLIIIGICLMALIIPQLLRRKPPSAPLPTLATTIHASTSIPAIMPSKSTSSALKKTAPDEPTIKPSNKSDAKDRPVDMSKMQTATVVRVNSANKIVLRIGDEHTGSRIEVRIIGLNDTPLGTDKGNWQKRQLEYHLLTSQIRFIEGRSIRDEQIIPVYIYYPGDDFLNEWFIFFGHGFYENDPENPEFDELFASADQSAKEEKNGLHDPEWNIGHPGR